MTGIFARFASFRTASQPDATTGENAITSTCCWMYERIAWIWFCCFCCALVFSEHCAVTSQYRTRRTAPSTLRPEVLMGDVNPFQSSASDRIRSVVLGGVGSVPLAGNALAAIVGEIWAPTIYKRMERCWEEIVTRIAQLEDALNDERLNSEAVTSAIAIASREATYSDDEKIHYLANAVANVVADDTWEHDVAATLLRFVGDLTASHLRVLAMLNDPEAWQATHGIKIQPVERDGAYFMRDMISDAFGRLGIDVDGLQIILQDLESRGLLNSIGFADETPSTFARELKERTSELGRVIVRFVTWNP